MAELLSCPFCGGAKARTIHIRDGRKVACICGACGKPEFHGPLSMPSAEDRAINAWNTRHQAEQRSLAIPGEGEAVAWMYTAPNGVVHLEQQRQEDWVRWGWPEIALYPHPLSAPQEPKAWDEPAFVWDDEQKTYVRTPTSDDMERSG